jgi:adenylate cyclase
VVIAVAERTGETTMTSTTRRRRAAILNADAVGYSRMMADDDLSALAMLLESFAHIAGCVRGHGGRVVNDAGDNVLAEFAHESSALRCAMELQRTLAVRNRRRAGCPGMSFRMGVHAGEVLAQGERIFGDVVNLAARLQSAAAAGGICVSETVAERVEPGLSRELVEAGLHRFKNIPHPLNVLRVR